MMAARGPARLAGLLRGQGWTREKHVKGGTSDRIGFAHNMPLSTGFLLLNARTADRRFFTSGGVAPRHSSLAVHGRV